MLSICMHAHARFTILILLTTQTAAAQFIALLILPSASASTVLVRTAAVSQPQCSAITCQTYTACLERSLEIQL